MSFGLSGTEQKVVLEKLRLLFEEADAVSIAVSYIQLSGWRLLSPMLSSIKKDTRILCTDQLGITDPSAVREIQKAGIAIHAYCASNTYHPKVYIAHKNGKPDKYVLGSANLSQSALDTSVEAVFAGEDKDGALATWFTSMFEDDKRSVLFDEKRLSRLELLSAARLKSRLEFQRLASKQANPPSDIAAMDTIETAFASLPDIVVPLNVDMAGNNVRTFRKIKGILDGDEPLEGKAFSEMKLLGFAKDGSFTSLGQSLKSVSNTEIAKDWMAWLKHTPAKELNSISPSGRLSQSRTAFKAFWNLPEPVTAYFLENCISPPSDIRLYLQTIELMANTGKAFPNLTIDDVKTLSTIVTATGQLPPDQQNIIKDYLNNKGTRGWREPDRKIILEAWKKA